LLDYLPKPILIDMMRLSTFTQRYIDKRRFTLKGVKSIFRWLTSPVRSMTSLRKILSISLFPNSFVLKYFQLMLYIYIYIYHQLPNVQNIETKHSWSALAAKGKTSMKSDATIPLSTMFVLDSVALVQTYVGSMPVSSLWY